MVVASRFYGERGRARVKNLSPKLRASRSSSAERDRKNHAPQDSGERDAEPISRPDALEAERGTVATTIAKRQRSASAHVGPPARAHQQEAGDEVTAAASPSPGSPRQRANSFDINRPGSDDASAGETTRTRTRQQLRRNSAPRRDAQPTRGGRAKAAPASPRK